MPEPELLVLIARAGTVLARAMALIPVVRALHQVILVARARTLAIVVMLVARARAVGVVVMLVARARAVVIVVILIARARAGVMEPYSPEPWL